MIAFNNKSGASRLQRGSKAQSSIGVSMAVWFKRAIGAGIFLALVIGAVAGLRAVERSPVGGVELSVTAVPKIAVVVLLKKKFTY